MATNNNFNNSGKSFRDFLADSYGEEMNAYGMSFDTYLNAAKQEQSSIPKEYLNAMRGAYSDSRASSIGKNENLANLGLGGNAYSSPVSGYSETSRLNQDVALQNTLQKLSSEQRGAAQSLQNKIAEAYAQRASDMATMKKSYSDQMQAHYKEALAAGQEYASAGQALPDYYKQAYEQASGRPYSELLEPAIMTDLQGILEKFPTGEELAEQEAVEAYFKNAISKGYTTETERDNIWKRLTGDEYSAYISNKVSKGNVQTYDADTLQAKLRSSGILDEYGLLSKNLKTYGANFNNRKIDTSSPVAPAQMGWITTAYTDNYDKSNPKNGDVVYVTGFGGSGGSYMFFDGYYYKIV